PQRLKECILSPEEKKKCEGILAQVCHRDTIIGARIAFEPDDVMWVLQKVQEYLDREPMLIEDLSWPIRIVGDLNGQLYDLDRIFDVLTKDGKPGWELAKYIFLGNYVGKGRQSIETLMGLFCIKMLFPDNIFLLRGTREFIDVNKDCGFYREFLVRYSEQETAYVLYQTTNDTFAYLSLAAIVG
ncbi:hypothetical protein PMAYCL1PPCAC_20124, partial [Pristionchus mayeri]